MKRKCINTSMILLLVLGLHFGATAQNNESGYIVSNGEMLMGKVEVDLESNQVSIEDAIKVQFLSAKIAQKAVTINHATGKQKIFYSGTFGLNSQPFFFEAISDGTMPLLYREGVKFNKYEETVYEPYFVLKDDKIYALGESKKEVLAIFSEEYEDEMAAFVKSNKINTNKKEDLKELFDHYQSVFQVAVN